jgi:Fe-S-cluster-containing dehydrogenase component
MREPRWAMAVDTRRCVGCNACVLACKQENALPEGIFRCWIQTETVGRFPNLEQTIESRRCNHCQAPACVSVCPTGASFVARGGLVLIDPDLCTGCKACMAACPYEARSIHPDGHADKCSFCAHRIARGRPPACVSVCPTQALTFGDLNDPESAVSLELRERAHRLLEPERGLRPNVYYLR